MDEYIKDLYEAFNSVDNEFYSTETIKEPGSFFDDIMPKSKFIQQTELHFSAELYSEWRKIIKHKSEYSDLKIGFEVSKKFIENNLVKDKKKFKPDLILHQSQINFHPDFQKIFIEIKTNSSLNAKKISSDVKKIVFAMKQYRFQNGVFISVNCNETRLLTLIVEVKNIVEKITNNTENKLWENIYLFYGNNEGIKFQKKFSDIIKVEKKKVDKN